MASNGQHPPQYMVRGVRGATTVSENSRAAILEATRELLLLMVERNEIEIDDIASVLFTTTEDLIAVHPALAARQLGWMDTALMCSHEMSVPESMPLCIRVLIHWNTARKPKEIQHVYLRDAVKLRPDLSLQTISDQQEKIGE